MQIKTAVYLYYGLQINYTDVTTAKLSIIYYLSSVHKKWRV